MVFRLFARWPGRAAMLIVLLSGLALVWGWPSAAWAQAAIPAFTATPAANGGETYSLNVQTLLLMTSLSFLPAALLMMTGFTRIIIVLGLVRTALGTAMSPPNHVLVGLALFLTFFTMGPVFDQVYTEAYQPLAAGSITFDTAMQRAAAPMQSFMLRQTRETDLTLFANLANTPEIMSPEQTPLRILVPAFITSELKIAFQIGFTIFIPFLIIDLIVASVLMSLGMMMVPPVTVALPFKLMLFVLADGWNLLMGSLAQSFLQ
jgi:flagellar biosynthetic protein FliP